MLLSVGRRSRVLNEARPILRMRASQSVRGRVPWYSNWKLPMYPTGIARLSRTSSIRFDRSSRAMEFLAWSRLVLLSLVLLSALLTLFAPLRAVGAQAARPEGRTDARPDTKPVAPPTPAQPGVILPWLGGARLTTTLRSRGESWRWFDDGAAGRYAFGAILPRLTLALERPRFAWRLEAVAPTLVDLPDDAVRGAPLGQLGLGASYAAANDNRSTLANVLVRQAWVEWRPRAAAVRVGRFEFADGVERTVATPALATLKTSRIGQRLFGPVGFSHVGRSTDGASLRVGSGPVQGVVIAGRPTSGVFTARDGGHTLDVDLGYGALVTGGKLRRGGEYDLRLFDAEYRDRRGLVATDDRALATRQADSHALRVSTVGAHAVAVVPVGRVQFDGLLWGAVQRGTWGSLDHHASALAMEGGIQWPRVRWSPWLRAGAFHSSGDAQPGDAVHGTFFQLLPTPRLYARFPFYNAMNSEELFGQGTFKLTRTVSARTGLNVLRLSETRDLWYSGGGAFDGTGFGYAGRPSLGERSLGRIADGALEWKPNRWVSMEGYLGINWGNQVARRIYGTNGRGQFGYVEMTLTR